MALKKVKLGDLINVVDERNNIGSRDFYGININKEFMPTVADTTGLDETKYKVVRKNRFVYSGMQTGRDECIRISMYLQDKPIIVSPAYTTFEVTAQDIVLCISSVERKFRGNDAMAERTLPCEPAYGRLSRRHADANQSVYSDG